MNLYSILVALVALLTEISAPGKAVKLVSWNRRESDAHQSVPPGAASWISEGINIEELQFVICLFQVEGN